jgi:hypothetical protein
MKTFEYATTSSRLTSNELNELGKQGWDLVAIHPEGKLFFKREIESSPKQEPRRNMAPSYETGR